MCLIDTGEYYMAAIRALRRWLLHNAQWAGYTDADRMLATRDIDGMFELLPLIILAGVWPATR